MLKLHLLDIICLAYLQLILIFILLFPSKIEKWESHGLFHFLLMAGIIFLVFLTKIFNQKRIFLFVRIFYPLALLFFSWTELRSLGQMIPFRQDLTALILKGEDCLFGLERLVTFRRSFPFVLDELMGFFYLSFYFYLPLATLIPFLRKKIDSTMAIVFIISLTYLSNFLLFYCFHCLSPNYLDLELIKSKKIYHQGFFSQLIEFIQAREGVKGAAFPSTHLSAATAIALVSWGYHKTLAIIFTVLLPLIGLSAVYLGYHHGLDCLVGFLWGGLSFLLGQRILKWQQKRVVVH